MADSVATSTDPTKRKVVRRDLFSRWLALEVSEFKHPGPIPPPGNLRRFNAMKVTRILAALALVSCLAGAAHAQNGCARLSWVSCNTWVENQNFVGPQAYTLNLSYTGVSAPNVGIENQIRVKHLEKVGNAIVD